jgi:DNA-binding transcriptional LysR family regulator
VSAAVSSLAREVGADLTERVGRSIRPTAAGEAFAHYAADVIGLLEQGERAALEAAQRAARELRIVAVTTAAEHLAPPLMQAFGQGHPDIGLTLDVGNREHVLRRVLEHGADVAIGGRPPDDERLVGEAFSDNRFALITSADDPLVAQRSVGLAELAGRPWLLREQGSGTRTLSEHFLASHELSPRVLTLGSNGAIKQAARAGIGVSLQSRVAVELELRTGLLGSIMLSERLPVRHWYALRSARGPVSAAVAAFLAFIGSEDAQRALGEWA